MTTTQTTTPFRLYTYTDMGDTTTTADFEKATDNPARFDDEGAAVAAARKWVADNTDATNPCAYVASDERLEWVFWKNRKVERWGQYESWRKCRVTDVSTVAEFLSRYYKRDRYTGRGEEYAACLLKSHTESFERNGFDIISHHDSNTGEVVAFYGEGVAS